MVEKMKLVRVQGTLPQLNDFLDACCMDGRFDLEPATRYMSDSLGYAALNEENPYPATRDQIETMAKEAGVELHKEQRHTDPPDEEAKAYLSDLLEQIDDLCAERQGLLDQQKLCEDGIAQYSHFLNLKVNVDEILDCQHVKVRFGFLPTEGYNKLMSNYADDPYILFVECTQTKTGYWGIYLTPREKALETDGIFSMLYFEPVYVPGAAGSPAEIIEHFKENLEVVKKSVDDVNARIAALWHDHEAKVQMLYDTVRYYAAMYDLRRMAAVKGSHFFCVGWVPAPDVEEIAGKDAPNFGQAKNSWLTGTAAWNFYVISNYILGIKPDWEGLKVDPCIPHTWDAYQVSRRFRGATYAIAIENPSHVCRGVKQVTVDGQAIAGNVLPVFADGKTHQVTVTLG